jgi:hypothetical protein
MIIGYTPDPVHWDAHLRKTFDAVMSPFANELLMILGSLQKDCPDSYNGDWQQFVADVVNGNDLLDAGQFPDEWYPEEDK